MRPYILMIVGTCVLLIGAFAKAGDYCRGPVYSRGTARFNHYNYSPAFQGGYSSSYSTRTYDCVGDRCYQRDNFYGGYRGHYETRYFPDGFGGFIAERFFVGY